MVELHVRRTELLEAMKGCLHDLEEQKLLTPDDLDIIDERRILRVKIAELEDELIAARRVALENHRVVPRA
jgi:hypothetical protein